MQSKFHFCEASDEQKQLYTFVRPQTTFSHTILGESLRHIYFFMDSHFFLNCYVFHPLLCFVESEISRGNSTNPVRIHDDDKV